MEKQKNIALEKLSFLKRKNIEISAKRYLQDAFSAMALGLFSSLLIGLIISTAGEQIARFIGESTISSFLIDIGKKAMSMMGPAIGVAVAWSLKAPPLVIFTSVITGMLGASTGGPAGAFIAVVIAAEFGKAVSKETRVDIIVTPAVCLIIGALTAVAIGPIVSGFMTGLGQIIITATQMRPFFFGIIISVIVGLALTAPISSAALCIMLDISGLAAGAATAGCCAQMIGFAVISYKDNGISGFLAQGIGTSMLQIPNIFKNPWILMPPTVAAAITGPISTVIFKMSNNSIGAGMGTSGLVGQIGCLSNMGFTLDIFIKILIVQIIIPAIIAILVDKILRKLGKIKIGDYKLDI